MIYGTLLALTDKGIAGRRYFYTGYSSAFTSVSHGLFLHKLRHSFNITGLAYSWIDSYSSATAPSGSFSMGSTPTGSRYNPESRKAAFSAPFSLLVTSLTFRLKLKPVRCHMLTSSKFSTEFSAQQMSNVHSLQADLNRFGTGQKHGILSSI